MIRHKVLTIKLIHLRLMRFSKLLKAKEAEGTEHDMAPDQQESCLGDVGQASDYHLDYIWKGPEE